MRIKNYDYDNVKKLKNPMGNYLDVELFIFETMELYKKYEGWLSYFTDERKDIFCCVDHIKEEITFYKKQEQSSFMLNDSFYNLPKNNQPYVRNKEYFEELKYSYLKYKLSKKLEKELVEKPSVSKRFKI